MFSSFRAIEVCREKNYKVARFIGVDDKSSSQTVQRTSSYSYQQPTYFSGSANTNYNFYGGTRCTQIQTIVGQLTAVDLQVAPPPGMRPIIFRSMTLTSPAKMRFME